MTTAEWEARVQRCLKELEALVLERAATRSKTTWTRPCTRIVGAALCEAPAVPTSDPARCAQHGGEEVQAMANPYGISCVKIVGDEVCGAPAEGDTQYCGAHQEMGVNVSAPLRDVADNSTTVATPGGSA